MLIRSLIAASAAILLSAAAIETAQAYPVTARSGTTTVTGVYRPLDLTLSLVDGSDALAYDNFLGTFSFTAKFSGTYAGYSLSGAAGDWQLEFGTTGFPSVTASDDSGNIISLSTLVVSDAVGKLTFLGGGDYTGVPAADLPAVGDNFKFFVDAPGTFLQVICQDGVGACTVFDVEVDALKQIGPYDGLDVLDAARVNTDCGVAPDYIPCGGVRVRASAPEPASLALVGLALGGLAWLRRRQTTT